MYVACYADASVVVMDGAGTRLATVAVPGDAYGVVVTRSGQIVVSYQDPHGLAVVG